MSYDKTFRFADVLPQMQCDQMGRYVRTKYRRDWHRRVAEQVMIIRARPADGPLTEARITCIRCSCTSKWDADNLRISFKPLMDGLVVAGVIADDDFATIGEPVVRMEKAKRGSGFVQIRVQGLPPLPERDESQPED